MKQVFNGAVVNSGCVLFFPEPQVSVQQNDIVDSLLYIQLAASKKHSKFTEFEQWKDTWLAAALRFGWTLKASAHVSEPLPATTANTAWSLINEALARATSESGIACIEALIHKANERTPEHPAMQVLINQAIHVQQPAPASSGQPIPGGTAKTTLTLLLGFVTADRNLGLTQLHFTTRQSLPHGFLFELLESEKVCGNVEVTVYSMRLMDQVYSPFRDSFDLALKEKRPLLVVPLGEVSDGLR